MPKLNRKLVSSSFCAGTLALFLGGWGIHNSQKSEAQPPLAKDGASSKQSRVGLAASSRLNGQKTDTHLWQKRFSDGSQVFLTSRPIAFKKATLAEIQALNPQVPAHRLKEISQPNSASEFNLMLQDENAPARLIWSLQQVDFDPFSKGKYPRILDVLREGESFIMAWRPYFGVAIDVVEKPPLKRVLSDSSPRLSLHIDEGGPNSKFVSQTQLLGSLKDGSLSLNIKWYDGAESSWAYRNGKWIETVKYVRPPDPNVIYRQQQLHTIRLKREELRRSLAGQPRAIIERKMKRFDRHNNLLPPGTPELTHDEARADYRDSLENMSASEIEAAMKGWDSETAPRKK